MDIRSRRTEEKLVGTMFALLEKKGFDAITVGDLCKSAGISRTTFYLHFEDKHGLALRCVEEVVLPPGLPGTAGVEAYIDSMLGMVHKRRKALRTLLLYDGSRELQRRMEAMFQGIYAQYYRTRLARGRLLDVPVEIAAIYHCSGITKLVEWWILEDFPVDKKQMSRYILELHEKALDR